MSRGWSSSAGSKGWHSWDCSPAQEKLWAELRVALQGLKELQDRWRETIGKGWRDSTQGMAASARGQEWMGSWAGIVPWQGGQGWHRVPRAAVAAPGSLAVPKARLDPGAGAAWDSGSCPCHGRGGTGWALRSLQTQTVMKFYDCTLFFSMFFVVLCSLL